MRLGKVINKVGGIERFFFIFGTAISESCKDKKRWNLISNASLKVLQNYNRSLTASSSPFFKYKKSTNSYSKQNYTFQLMDGKYIAWNRWKICLLSTRKKFYINSNLLTISMNKVLATGYFCCQPLLPIQFYCVLNPMKNFYLWKVLFQKLPIKFCFP